MLRRFGAIGDVHAEDELLQSAIRQLRALGAERVLVVGDVVDGRGDVDRCVSMLQAPDIAVVRGNHERWWLAGTMRDLPDATPAHALSQESRDFFQALPVTRTFDTPAGQLLLCHGLGDNDMASVKPDDYGYALESNLELGRLRDQGRARVVVNGHSHQRMVRTFGPLTIINAGTLHRPHGPSFTWVDLEAKEALVYALGRAEGEWPLIDHIALTGDAQLSDG